MPAPANRLSFWRSFSDQRQLTELLAGDRFPFDQRHVTRLSAAFITNIAESDFRYTQGKLAAILAADVVG